MNKSAVGMGTCGGLLMGIFPTLIIGDIIRTVLLAIVGAVVSFFVSLLLANLVKRKNK
ncbi:hypothetical protein H8S90_19710 [Olivibacter sp. SDN3]|uniref:hypothetical protein n=1 Tax=Olivibacter sp. SDN3 TaxID=2764720 RepID=UPI0016516143|nr:hypothetical protein [Olivibacter sp. SDN3]QNL48958.1 hypothetical protein H8S90_19710 [Olivibacter sp. SDN3]